MDYLFCWKLNRICCYICPQVLCMQSIVRAELSDTRMLLTSDGVTGCGGYCFAMFNCKCESVRVKVKCAYRLYSLFMSLLRKEWTFNYLENWTIITAYPYYIGERTWILDLTTRISYCLGWNMLRDIVPCMTFVEHVVMEKCWIVLMVPCLWRYKVCLLWFKSAIIVLIDDSFISWFCMA